MTKQLIISAGVASVAVLALGSYAVGSFDPTTFQNQLNNHETRINTLERPSPTPTPTIPQGSQEARTTTTYIYQPATPTGVTVAETTVGPTPQPTTEPTPEPVVSHPQATVAPQRPVSDQDLQDMFARVGPPGELRPNKVNGCWQLYQQHNQPKDQAQQVCGDENVLEHYSNY